VCVFWSMAPWGKFNTEASVREGTDDGMDHGQVGVGFGNLRWSAMVGRKQATAPKKSGWAVGMVPVRC
jgi:hypothetical protein